MISFFTTEDIRGSENTERRKVVDTL
jgi:hypothetical protein